jgi:hypothetical protein
MLDVDLESVRRDIHAYTLGLLWLLALIAAFVSSGDIRKFAIFLDALAQQMNHVAVPAYAAGFLLAAIGVVLPYCMFQVFEPLTLTILNACYWIVSKFSETNANAGSNDLNTSALAAMKGSLGVDLGGARDRCEIFVEGFLPRLAKSLAREHQINAFRWKALVPASFLTASVASRISATLVPALWHLTVGTIIGLIVFVLGVRTAIIQAKEENHSRNVAVLVAAKDSDKAPQ